MEGTNNGLRGGGVTVVGSGVPSEYHVAPGTTNENPPQVTGSPSPAAVAAAPAPADAAGGVGIGDIPTLKKKRGRPRKYGPDGSVAKALSPKPISSSAPLPPVIDFSASGKRGKVRPVTLPAKRQEPLRVECDGLGEWVSCSVGSVGANFTPHMITVNTGEDITMKIISFSQQDTRVTCILSANGVISSVTLRQADSSGGTLTYEIVLGSFLAGSPLEQKTKKHKPESVTIISAGSIPIANNLGFEDTYNSSPSFRGDNWSSINVTLAE
ncbi:AT hook motif DNA-binding family protein [Striga asiatica]|uniref:AT-hook motif nuclear-localized protein n=1 Tax=Striga asiatica TaxID=4170 RepID=A0A5A7PDE8_STRAF|nr:AT hook motif DNA-binding family protein [Striga asiatica]